MRTKFEQPRVPSEEELAFIDVMEKYGKATIDGICRIVFGKPHTASLERTLRTFKERYRNFKYMDVIPKGIIIKTTSEHNKPMYELVTSTHEIARKLILQSELDKVCYIIQNVNTRKILGELQHIGQYKHLDMYDVDELKRYQQELESELNETTN